MRDFLTDAMARRKLDLEMLKMVESTLLESPDFSLNKKMPKDVRVVLAGVFLTSFKADAHISLKASLHIPVRFKKSLFVRLDDVSKSILRFSFS